VRLGLAAQVLDAHRVQARHQVLLELLPERPDHARAERGVRNRPVLAHRFLEPLDHADDLADADPPALAREPVAAPGPAHALEHAGAHQLLEDLLEVAARQP
jgi:hypothetical protein